MMPYLLVLIAAAFTAAANGEDCKNPGSTLKAALAQDADLPLSLVQVKAVATRNNKTHQANQSLGLANVTLNAGLPAKKGSWLFEGMWGSETLRAFYLVFSILILVLIVNFSLVYVQFQRQETRKKQRAPKIQLPADHLIATSKLNLGPEPMKKQLSFYSRAKQSGDVFVDSRCPTRASSRRTSSEQPASADVAMPLVEALDPKLVLPLRETWYAVAIEEVLKADGSFEILRITGCPSLRASVCYGAGHGGSLELFCCNGGAKHLLARTSVREPDRPRGGGDVDEARGPQISLMGAGGRDLGELRSVSSRSFELIHSDEVVLMLAVDDAGQLEVSSASGCRLACASCLAGNLGICVNAGADTGLAVCLVLAAVLLGGAGEHVLPKSGDAEMRDEDICDRTAIADAT